MRPFDNNRQGAATRYAAESPTSRAPLWRLMRVIWSNYRFSLMTVAACIVVTSLTTLASTLFTRSLIDDYIAPLTAAATRRRCCASRL